MSEGVLLRHMDTGDVLEIPPPDCRGYTHILLNGKSLQRVRYSDDDPGYAEIEDGTRIGPPNEFTAYVSALVRAAGAPAPGTTA